MSFQDLSFLSYKPYLSTKSLNNSIGGWAPYSSTAGILISSIKTTVFLLGLEDNSFFDTFSNFPSIDNYVTKDDVYAENIKLKWSIFNLSLQLTNIVAEITDFPVPEAPVK